MLNVQSISPWPFGRNSGSRLASWGWKSRSHLHTRTHTNSVNNVRPALRCSVSGAYSLTKRARTHNFICSSLYGTMGGLWPPDLNFNVAVLTRQIIFFLNKISTAVRFTAKFCSCPLAAEGCLRCWPSLAAKKPQGQRNWRQEEAVGLAIPSFTSCIMENNCPGRVSRR